MSSTDAGEIFQNYVQHVDELRKRFAEVFKDNIQKNAYDKRDLDRLQSNDAYACCFLKHQNGSLEKACEMVDVSLRWRNELRVNDMTEQSFSRALHEAGGIFYHGHDKNGHPMLHIVVAKNRKDAFPPGAVKQMLAWHIDQEFLKNPGRKIVVLIDMTDAGLSNVDVDLIKFQVACFTTYYPALLAYMLIFEMPWVLNAIWKIIKKLLNAEQQRSVLLVKKPEMPLYIDNDQLFVHMGGSDSYKYIYVPSVESGYELRRTESDCESLTSSYENPPSTPILTTGLRKRVTFSGLRKSVTFDGFDNLEFEDQSSHHTSTDNSVHHGSLADISPSERLTFVIDSSKPDSLSYIRITNTSTNRLSFKVKTTSPDVYRVKPHTGLLAVNDKIVISILLPNGHKCTDVKDKFLVMLLSVKDDISEGNQDQLNAVWKNVSRDPKDYMEYRLMCEKVPSNGLKTIKPAIKTPTTDSSLEEKVDRLLSKHEELQEQLKNVHLLLRAMCVFLGIIVVLVLFRCL